MSLVGVADAGPLLHLAQVDALWLLSTFDDLLVPETVVTEVSVGGPPAGLDDLPHEVVADGDPPAGAAELDPGESAATAVALDRDAVLLTDDMAARTVATVWRCTVRSASSRSLTDGTGSTSPRRRRCSGRSAPRRASTSPTR